ncbi:MAG TPA: hypothetical protein VHE56_06570 [Mycobacteriales bacterium]|nr:hypothetical protein [Mycobacteriales bacterium]
MATEERRGAQRRVYQQRRPRRRVEEPTADAERRHADRRSGLERRRAPRESSAEIYEWLNLPSWRE